MLDSTFFDKNRLSGFPRKIILEQVVCFAPWERTPWQIQPKANKYLRFYKLHFKDVSHNPRAFVSAQMPMLGRYLTLENAQPGYYSHATCRKSADVPRIFCFLMSSHPLYVTQSSPFFSTEP